MAEQQHKAAREAVQAFQDLFDSGVATTVAGRPAGRGARDADVIVTFVDGPTVAVEVKANRACQVRPVEYRVLAVCANGGWWVVSPAEVMLLAAQLPPVHGYNPFVCTTIGTPMKRLARWRCNDADVAARVRAAFEHGEESALKAVAQDVQRDCAALAAAHKELVRQTAA